MADGFDLALENDFVGKWAEPDELRVELGREPGDPITGVDDQTRQVINLHMQRVSMPEIARRLGKSTNYVACILHDPFVGEIVRQLRADFASQFDNLLPKVIEAISDGLQDTDIMVRLAASKLWLSAKSASLLAAPSGHDASAEELVKTLLRERKARPQLERIAS